MGIITSKSLTSIDLSHRGLQNSFDRRFVDYKHLHRIADSHYDWMFDELKIFNGMKILDAGGGYGLSIDEINSRSHSTKIEYHLSERSLPQLRKAKDNLSLNKKLQGNFLLHFDDIASSCLPIGYFDVVILKMVLHEMSSYLQKSTIKEAFKLLKRQGRLIIWDLDIAEKYIDFTSDLIRKKDTLAGYTDFFHNRNYFNFSSLSEYLEEARFDYTGKKLEFTYSMHTIDRVETEFNGDQSKLMDWNTHIKKLFLNQPQLNLVEEKNNNIIVDIPKAIYIFKKI